MQKMGSVFFSQFREGAPNQILNVEKFRTAEAANSHCRYSTKWVFYKKDYCVGVFLNPFQPSIAFFLPPWHIRKLVVLSCFQEVQQWSTKLKLVIQIPGPPAMLLKRDSCASSFLCILPIFLKIYFQQKSPNDFFSMSSISREYSFLFKVRFKTITSAKYSKMYHPTCTDTFNEFIYFDFCCSLEACQTLLRESPMFICSSVAPFSQYWLISNFLHEVEFQ